MSIETLYRVKCQPCGRYLPTEGWACAGDDSTEDSADAALFLDFASAYNEAVRRGWSAYPLLCPDCVADLTKKENDRA